MARDAKYFRLATRMCAELGATYLKTYYVDEEFDTVTACCPVPIVIAGGKKIPEVDASTWPTAAVRGAAGVDMGRNIFQAKHRDAMMQAVRKVVHEDVKPAEAFELYQTLAAEGYAPFFRGRGDGHRAPARPQAHNERRHAHRRPRPPGP